ncbi:MAG: signal peptidase I [Desulfovibrio sp.]
MSDPYDPLKTFKEYIEAIAIAILLALVIRSFVVQAFKIPSGSMLQTLQIGDQLLVTRFSYDIKVPFTDISIIRTGTPENGDIVVFRYPEDPALDFIKRVAGVPGDVLEMRNKVLYRNGVKVDEPYVQHVDPVNIPIRDSWGPITVPEDKYFALGDNRENSRDSRYWGFVDRDALVGEALIIYWSWDKDFSPRWNRIGTILR